MRVIITGAGFVPITLENQVAVPQVGDAVKANALAAHSRVLSRVFDYGNPQNPTVTVEVEPLRAI